MVGVVSAAAVGGTAGQLDPEAVLRLLPIGLVLAALVVVVGLVAGYGVVRLNRRLLIGVGVDEAVDGTAFERAAGQFGTSTVSILAGLSGAFVTLLAVVLALSLAQVTVFLAFWGTVVGFLPQVFVAAVVVVVGVIVGDKLAVVVDERLQSVKLPETGLLPGVVKWSVFYVAGVIALAQLRVATDALVVLLAAYVFALIVVPTVVFRDLLSSAGAGLYLLLREPYAIGDRVRIGSVEGVVQEMDLFTTRVEADDREVLVPNSEAFEDGVVRIRD